MLKYTLTRSILWLSLAAVSSCGWQLRGTVSGGIALSKSGVTEINVISNKRSNEFFRKLLEALTRRNIMESNDAELMLQLSPESLERRPLTYSRSGVPAQYQLELRVQYQVSRQNEVILPQREIVTRRNYDFDATLIIEKDREQEELLDEMRAELVEIILAATANANIQYTTKKSLR